MRNKLELLTTNEMAGADQEAVNVGIPSLTLMENAGRAVADIAGVMMTDAPDPAAPIAILCGPGNNGGDGFVAARHLKKSSCDVRVGFAGEIKALKGDALEMAQRWQSNHAPCDAKLLEGCGLIIDAMFGAGLTRPINESSSWSAIIAAANKNPAPILAVDVPSGLNGTSGQADGPVIDAVRTITFFRRKPGHLLFPGRRLCGETVIADIGIPESTLETLSVNNQRQATWANDPALWHALLPRYEPTAHKYNRGHALIISGPKYKTGAARLAARAALRIGSGLVTLASPIDAAAENAAQLTAIMLEPFDKPQNLGEILTDKRKNTVLIGPGCGIGPTTCELVSTILRSNATVVLDADALTSFANDPDLLFEACHTRANNPTVMTPHEGEFGRLFPDLKSDRLNAARQAAQRSGAIIVLKGADTVIAAPDGRAAINENAPPWLATAGSGDVLAGFITGLRAQSMEAFSAACAAVWLHGDCAHRFGRSLIAEDLPERLPMAMAALHDRR